MNKKILNILIVAAAVVSYAAPVNTFFSPLLLLIVIIVGFLLVTDIKCKVAWLFVACFLYVQVLFGSLDISIVLSLLSAAILISNSIYSPLGLLIISINTSIVGTIQSLFSDALALYGIEAAAIAVLIIILLTLTTLQFSVSTIIVLSLSVVITIVGNNSLYEPSHIMWLAIIPVIIYSVQLTANINKPSFANFIFPLTIIIISMATWIAVQPRTFHSTHVILPSLQQDYIERLVKNYDKVLNFAGIEAKNDRLDLIPNNALILIPFFNDYTFTESSSFIKLANLADERRWTIIVAGEHTNFDGVADRINDAVNNDIMRKDLTVPPKNRDINSVVRAADIKSWPYNAKINRGASLSVSSLLDKVLISADGWWTEPDIGDSSWVGDYIWQKNNRAGRLVLSSTHDEGNSRWVIVGDNSLLLSKQILQNPRPVLRLRELASLWPTFICDASIMITGLLIIYSHISKKHNSTILFVIISCIFFYSILSTQFSSKPSKKWTDLFANQPDIESRNFSQAFVDNIELLNTDWNFIFPRKNISSIYVSDKKSVYFTHVDEKLHLNNINLNGCRRIGNLKTKYGPTLMDAQICSVEGDAEILIGDKEQAAAFMLNGGESKTLIILDTAFLSHRAPTENTEWLLEILSRY